MLRVEFYLPLREKLIPTGKSASCVGISAPTSITYLALFVCGRSFIGDWVSIAKTARLSTKAAAGNLSFDKQCAHCEKVNIFPLDQ